MSEAAQAPSQGAEGLPGRPPSKPSRAPLYIWGGIAVFCLLMFGSAFVLVLWSRQAFSGKDLKGAKAVTIHYILKGNVKKSVVVNDPARLQGLLDALEIVDVQMGLQSYQLNRGSLDFTLANGKTAEITFVDQNQLNRANWGIIHVTPAFHRKVNEILMQAEGRPIDVLRPDN